MAYLLAAFLVLLVAAPVYWIMPTPRQRQQARLREVARKLGLQVQVVSLPQQRRARVRREAQAKGTAYRLRGRKGVTPRAWEVVRTDDGGWETETLHGDGREAVLNVAREMPADVIALQSDAGGVAAYWRERGGEAAVKDIHRLLEQLQYEDLAT